MHTAVKQMDYYVPSDVIYEKFSEEPMAVFLDSSLHNELGGYSIIGLHPYLVLKEMNQVLYVNGESKEETFEQYMESYLKEHAEVNETKLPLISGGIGYLTYDYGRKFEKIPSRHTATQVDIPDALFCFYEHYIIEDINDKRIYLSAKGETEASGLSLYHLEMLLEEKLTFSRRKSPKAEKYEKTEHNPTGTYIARYGKEEYIQAVEDVIRYIVEGDIYVCNMTQQLRILSPKHPYEVFKYLRVHNPSPFGGFFNYDTFQIVSASPERFIRVKEGVAETRPIKGTRKRGITEEEDNILKEELRNSEKDKSELLMIVDLERNDLNRVCEPGSVQVVDNFALETYATLYHLVSTVRGKLREDVTVMELLRASFPGGSITGAPKIRAMEIIDQLEGDRRGLYTGTIGYCSLDGNCDFNIVIRTAVYQNGEYHLGVGGGITYESDTEFEYEEILQKAKAIFEAAAVVQEKDDEYGTN